MHRAASNRPIQVTSCTDPHRGRIVVSLWEYPGQPFRIQSAQGFAIVDTWGRTDVLDVNDVLRGVFPSATDFRPIVGAQLLPGEYHPRVWRNGICATRIEPNAVPMNVAELPSIRQRVIALHRIQRQLEEVFEVVTPTTAHAVVYGEATGQILTLAATEVEQLLKEAYVANSDATKRSGLFKSLNMGQMFPLGEHAHRDHRKRRMTIVRNA